MYCHHPVVDEGPHGVEGDLDDHGGVMHSYSPDSANLHKRKAGTASAAAARAVNLGTDHWQTPALRDTTCYHCLLRACIFEMF